jgi:hypothetical protein
MRHDVFLRRDLIYLVRQLLHDDAPPDEIRFHLLTFIENAPGRYFIPMKDVEQQLNNDFSELHFNMSKAFHLRHKPKVAFGFRLCDVWRSLPMAIVPPDLVRFFEDQRRGPEN